MSVQVKFAVIFLNTVMLRKIIIIFLLLFKISQITLVGYKSMASIRVKC